MDSKSNTESGGMGVVDALGILFVALKLLGIIDWSWWWVTLPFWGGFALAILALAVISICVVVILWFERNK